MEIFVLFTFVQSRVVQSLHSDVLAVLVVARHCSDVMRMRSRQGGETFLTNHLAEGSPSFLQEPLGDENANEESSAQGSSDQSCDGVILPRTILSYIWGKI